MVELANKNGNRIFIRVYFQRLLFYSIAFHSMQVKFNAFNYNWCKHTVQVECNFCSYLIGHHNLIVFIVLSTKFYCYYHFSARFVGFCLNSHFHGHVATLQFAWLMCCFSYYLSLARSLHSLSLSLSLPSFYVRDFVRCPTNHCSYVIWFEFGQRKIGSKFNLTLGVHLSNKLELFQPFLLLLLLLVVMMFKCDVLYPLFTHTHIVYRDNISQCQCMR